MMNKMIDIRPVNTKREMDDFVRLPRIIYAGNKYYVPDLDSDIRNFFNPKKNSGLKFAKVQAWVAYREGELVGRVAGIINPHANEKWGVRNVRFGFIEFIDDMEVSAALINAVEQWGKEQGMTEIQGPMGLTDFDKEGMLIEDFDMTGSMTAIYNHPYYPLHMDALGFEKEADWVQIQIRIPSEPPERFARMGEFARQHYGIHVKKLTKSQIMGDYGKKIFHILNEAYNPLFGFVTLTPEQIQDFIKMYLPMADPDLITMLENDKDEAIGVAVSIGSLAKALNKSRGKLMPFGWYHLMKSLFWKHEDTVEMLLIGLLPEYQGKGINTLFFNDLIHYYNKKHFVYGETGPQLEHNIKEITQWNLFGPKLVKRRRCYCRRIK